MFRGGEKKAYHTPPWKPEISQADLPTYLSQPEVVQRVSKRAEMIKQPVGGRPLALIDLKVINFLAFLGDCFLNKQEEKGKYYIK